jgi:invasion protein IalB
LGVALEKGLEFTMPGEKAEAFGFGACNRATCDAQLSVADDGFAKMEAAGSFEIAYTTLSGERIAANVSMKGLADAFTRIEKPAVAPAAEPAPAAAAAPATEPATPPAEQPAATPDQ